MSNSVRPHRWQPTRFHRLWDSPGKNTGMGCHFLLQWRKVKSENEVSLSRVRLFATPWTAAYQAPPSMGFSRQEYWNGMPFHMEWKCKSKPQWDTTSWLLGCLPSKKAKQQKPARKWKKGNPYTLLVGI